MLHEFMFSQNDTDSEKSSDNSPASPVVPITQSGRKSGRNKKDSVSMHHCIIYIRYIHISYFFSEYWFH